MALGLFDKTAIPSGWFDETSQADGWFDGDDIAASASGSPVTITATIATASATGNQATIAQSVTISAAIGSATASGKLATIAQAASIYASLGVASASGNTASLTQATTVSAGIGNATANGYQAGISQDATINALIGNGAASGYLASIAGGAASNPTLYLILAILTGRKVYDPETKLWHVYDANGVEIVDPSGILMQGLHGWLLRGANESRVTQTQAVSGNKKRKRWIERDGKILVFDTEDQAQAYIKAEQKPVIKSKKVNKPKEIIKPVEIINKVEIKRLANIYNYRQKLYHADQIGDISLIIAIYKEMQAREEEDLEILLMYL